MQEIQSQRRTFWVDVEDFFLYFEGNPRPSGIQRLVFETLKVLPERARLAGGNPRVAFVRHTTDSALLTEVTFAEIAAVFEGKAMARGQDGPRVQPGAPEVRERLVRRLRRWLLDRIWKMPPEISAVLLRAGVLQMAALRQFRQLRRPKTQPQAVPVAEAAPAAEVLAASAPGFPVDQGDLFLILGAPWAAPAYGMFLRQLLGRYPLEAALLVYDLIPLRRPEWCAADLVQKFDAWLRSTMPQCSRLMAISKATAADVEAYAREVGLTLAGPVRPVPIGTDFGLSMSAGEGEPPALGLPKPGSYVLFVSTMEARKNHAMLFKVWRRLVSDLPSGQVPTLVFAGRVGWLVSDLMQQLENTDWLDGKIRMIRDPTDAELAALYDGCLFTVFPSLFEGWGLPVSESLGRGQPCLTSNRTSLPEAGGALARYFDPENLDDAYRAVRALIDDRPGLEAWRAEVRCLYRHTPWEDTADAILAHCLGDTALAALPAREAVS